MNFTNDGQPLGEHIDMFEAIQRGAVVGILFAADEVLATKQLAERQTKALNKVRELHKPFKIYGECDCTPEQQDDEQTHVEVDDVGRTCNLLYRICESCCYDGYSQSEDCACSHEHGLDKPICATVRILDEAGA